MCGGASVKCGGRCGRGGGGRPPAPGAHQLKPCPCLLRPLPKNTLDIPVYGRISALRLFKPKVRPRLLWGCLGRCAACCPALTAPHSPQASAQDLLFVLTEHYRFFILRYDVAAGETWGDWRRCLNASTLSAQGL